MTPSKGKLRILYNALAPNKSVSRKDLEKLIEELNKEYPDKKFGQGDIENLLYQKRGFMISDPLKEGYFLRSDSRQVQEKASFQEKEFNNLDTSSFSKKLEEVNRQYQQTKQQIDAKVKQKEALDRELLQDREKLEKLEEVLELAYQFFRQAA